MSISRLRRAKAKAVDPMYEECPVRAALDVIRGRWKPVLLCEIHRGPKRYSQLQEALPMISPQAMTLQLRQLEADGVISRSSSPDAPSRVEYRLTEFGSTLSDVMDQLEAWGSAYLQRKKQAEGADPA